MAKTKNLGIDCGFDKTDIAEFEMLVKLLKVPASCGERDWDRMEALLRMRYLENLTLKQIGQRIQRHQERVRCIINFAIRKIQHEIYKRERRWNECEPELRVLIKEKVKHVSSWEIVKKMNHWTG